MSTQRYEMEAWLGDDHGLTDEQVTDLMRIADDIEARYCTPDPDGEDPEQEREDLIQATQDERDAALTIAYRLLTEPAADVVRELRTARIEATRTRSPRWPGCGKPQSPWSTPRRERVRVG